MALGKSQDDGNMSPALLMYLKKNTVAIHVHRVNPRSFWKEVQDGTTAAALLSFKDRLEKNIHKLFVTSKNFPVQKMNFTT